MKFQETGCHSGKIRQHVIVSDESPKGLHGLGDWSSFLYDFCIRPRRALVPSPSISKRFDLCRRLSAISFSKENVVVLIALEWWVEIDEVNSFIANMSSKNVQVVSVVEQVRHPD